ncbi:MAG TPA: hypothetical protein VLL08_30405 [Kineosporiaceae bacterium]|nr:hypothetical protein [Kineosporiaceae bacterium]
MKLNGPYLTLAGGLAVAGVLLSLSVTAVRKDGIVATSSPVGSVVAGKAKPTESAKASPEAEAAPSGTYAGAVKGGDASIAIAIKNGKAIAYVCDGKTAEAWLQGAADDASLSLKGEGGSALTAKYANGRLSGTVKASGQKWTFKVKTVKAPSGLYRASRNVRNAKVVGGWIVYRGKQVGMLNTAGTETPAPPIDLETRTVTIDGTTVETSAVDGSPLG